MQASDVSSSFGKTFTILTLLLIGGLLFLFFDNYLEKQRNPNQQVNSYRSGGQVVTELTRNRAGHYLGSVEINGQSIGFMLDTGATTVAISEQAATKLGLRKGREIQVSTANGVATAWRSEIAELKLGEITLTNVPASIVPNLTGTEILLGMSALKQLEFRQQGNQLTLIQYL